MREDRSQSWPKVSFDISLGKKYDFIDFDYEKYSGLVEELGGTPDDFSEVKIRISPAKPLLPSYINHGTGEIRLRRRAGKLNGALAHETQHFIDYRHQNIAERSRKLSTASAQTLMASTAIMLYAKSGSMLSEPYHDNIAEGLNQAKEAASVSTLVAYIGFLAFYVNGKSEKRARKAAKSGATEQIITLIKR